MNRENASAEKPLDWWESAAAIWYVELDGDDEDYTDTG